MTTIRAMAKAERIGTRYGGIGFDARKNFATYRQSQRRKMTLNFLKQKGNPKYDTDIFLHDTEIEQSVIASCIHYSDDRQETLTRVKKGVFYQERHGIIFEAIDQITTTGLEPDLVTLADHLKNSGNLEKAGGGHLFARITGQCSSRCECRALYRETGKLCP